MGSLTDRIQHDLTEAMRARDELRVSTLRLALAAIKKAAVAGDEQIVVGDDAVLTLLASERKKRLEAAELYEQGDRAELAAKERAEADVIAEYLPAMLDDAELQAIIDQEVANATAAGATGGKAMGAVIKAVRDRVGQQADGARIAALVKAALG
jgi:uncharacterized protein YqeY